MADQEKMALIGDMFVFLTAGVGLLTVIYHAYRSVVPPLSLLELEIKDWLVVRLASLKRLSPNKIRLFTRVSADEVEMVTQAARVKFGAAIRGGYKAKNARELIKRIERDICRLPN